MKSKLLVSVNHFGRIPPLYQDGPIIHPIWVDIRTAGTLVSCHYKTFEHNPHKPSEKVLLTFDNLTTDNFPPFIPEIKQSYVDGGVNVSIVNSLELPKPDRIKESSEVETNVTSNISSEESNTSDSNSKTSLENDGEEHVDDTVEQTSDIKEDVKLTSQMSLTERAESLGIDTTGMSRNKIRAAIREKENKK